MIRTSLLSILSIILLAGYSGRSPRLQNTKEKPQQETSVVKDTVVDPDQMRKLRKLWIAGEFDGKPGHDTIVQRIYSYRTDSEMESGPDPLQFDADVMKKWHEEQQVSSTLIFRQGEGGTLNVGRRPMFYCLLNVGDNNRDGKDEIALSVNRFDESPENRCFIYTICDYRWVIVQDIGVHEDAFSFTGEGSPVFGEIKGYLKKRNGRWVYRDYDKYGYYTQGNENEFQALDPQTCD